MDTKDPAVEKTELIIDALQYAQTHNLDINNKDDVKIILEVLNEDNQDIEEFIKLLQNADAFMEMNAPKKTDLPN